MPELPEVETTRRGIATHILSKRITGVVIRDKRLRWPIPDNLRRTLLNKTFSSLDRRAKYLLFHLEHGCMILHLGMSGSLRIVTADSVPGKHDHMDIIFADNGCLRLRDPRRFGSVHWTTTDPWQHPLLKELGPEPLSDEFDGSYLYSRSKDRRRSVKNFLMDSRIVVGIGNIYANESLFAAGIHPKRPAGRISTKRYDFLADATKNILRQALDCGGTTLRDFVNGDGNPGYFRQSLRVYARVGDACYECGTTIRQFRLGQRSTFYCPSCQT